LVSDPFSSFSRIITRRPPSVITSAETRLLQRPAYSRTDSCPQFALELQSPSLLADSVVEIFLELFPRFAARFSLSPLPSCAYFRTASRSQIDWVVFPFRNAWLLSYESINFFACFFFLRRRDFFLPFCRPYYGLAMRPICIPYEPSPPASYNFPDIPNIRR